MDFEEKRRRQLIRVVIAEVGMVLSVIAIVVVAILAAMGFMISGNGSIEQSGLIQIHSLPTGANVKIDGNTIMPRTNLSRSLVDGTHSIEIYRDGYDTWQNNIQIKAGVLTRLYYPRLFLQNRTSEQVKNLTSKDNLEFYSPSPKRNYILYAEKGASDWQLLDIRGDDVKTTIIDVSGVLWGMVEENETKRQNSDTVGTHTYKFHGTIEELKWSNDENNILVKVSYDGKMEWILVHLREVARSLNLTQVFGLGNDAKLEVIDDAANQLYILERQQLRRINTADETISRVLVDKVQSFANNGMRVIYVAETDEQKLVGVFRDDDKSGTVIKELPKKSTVRVALSEYYGDDYMSWLVDRKLTILYGRLPSYNANGIDMNSYKYLVEDLEMSELPDAFSASPDGDYLVARKGTKHMVTELSDGQLYEYTAPAEALRWLDGSMMYAIRDQEILVWDFDGANLRKLTKDVAKTEEIDQESASKNVLTNADLVIANNDRWMYYLANGEKFTVLTREKIRD